MIIGILLPFLGTTLGAACVFFMKSAINKSVERSLIGFAAGVMVAASIWSLIVPALEQSAILGTWEFIPAVAGFWLGILFLLTLDRLIPHLHMHAQKSEGLKSDFKKTTMLLFAVTLHNIPEGMAVGVVYAGLVSGGTAITAAAAIALSAGIAIQNFPEGAIISLPLCSEGIKKSKAFLLGTLSGLVEPIAAIITVMLSDLITPALPYFLSFAAGAMMYVVIEELIPEMSEGEHSNIGTVFFALGFTLMLALDVALG